MIEYQFREARTLGEAFEQLYAILKMLRSPQGCPWDREQKPYDSALSLMEELYEYLDALDANDKDGIQEEIGDVLLNALMIMRMHYEIDDLSPIDAVNDVCAKLIRRHPHVFSTAHATNSSEVLKLWNSVKETVEGKKEIKADFFERIPQSMPPLDEAWQIQKKMEKVGFDWPDINGVLAKVQEELTELQDALQNNEGVEQELGDLLFSVINVTRYIDLHPSVALHKTNKKIRRRFNEVVRLATEAGIAVEKKSADALNELWDQIKEEEHL